MAMRAGMDLTWMVVLSDDERKKSGTDRCSAKDNAFEDP